MRLLFLNRCFWPDVEATGPLLAELCEDLARDHQVTVIAGPSYHFAPAQRRLLQRDAFGSVVTVRTWGSRFSKKRLLGRLLNLGTYYVLAAVAALRSERPDVVVAETDPPLLGLLGAFLKHRWNCRFIYYCQDLYPEIAEVTGGVRNPLLLAILRRANRLAYAAADEIVVIGRDMEERLVEKGLAADKMRVVTNWVDCDAVRPPEDNPVRAELGDRFVIMYSGNLGLTQPLDTVVEVARWMRNDARILFVFVGEGVRKPWLEERVRTLGLSNVRFLPYQPKERLGHSLAAADLHVIPLREGAAGYVVPSKLYGILAAGRPFVAMVDDFSEVARVAREHGVGLVVPPGDAAALENVIQMALADRAGLKKMGDRGRRLAEERFDRHLVTREFAALVEGFAERRADERVAS